MTAALTLGGGFGPGVRRRGYRDPVSGHEVLVTTPGADPQRWQEYLAGARRSYRDHGVEHVLDLGRNRDGRTTSVLFALLSGEGETIGGVRVQGPYATAEESHAVTEWENASGRAAVRAVVDRLVPDGLVELKAGWLAEDRPGRRASAALLSRIPIHAASVLGARHAMLTAGEYSVPRWTVAGGVVATEVPPVAYPDDRYRTRLVWWDREALRDSLPDRERRAVEDEAAQLRAPDVSGRPAW